eukprot:20032_1
MALFLLFLVRLVLSETINRNTAVDYSPVNCTSFPCIINCAADSSCRKTRISCPIIGTGLCTLNFMGNYAATESTINTGTSTTITITIDNLHSLYDAIIYANNTIGSKLTLNVNGDDSLRYTNIFAPYGVDSELNINCISSSGPHYDFVCANMKIYTDYSTSVSLITYSTYGFYQTVVYQYSDMIKSLISTHPNYINYRASVHLWASIYDRGFQEFIFYGTDHGNWTIYSQGFYGFYMSVIYADHSFITNDKYTITVSDSANGETQCITDMTLYASQNNGIIKLIGYETSAFRFDSNNYFELICNKPEMSLYSLEIVAI